MASKLDDWWRPTELSSDDQKLVDAYVLVGRPLDQLPYTQEFDRLMKVIGFENATEDDKYMAFQRLLQLRKKGRLPRLGRSSAEAF
jgi:hypothetical protein